MNTNEAAALAMVSASRWVARRNPTKVCKNGRGRRLGAPTASHTTDFEHVRAAELDGGSGAGALTRR